MRAPLHIVFWETLTSPIVNIGRVAELLCQGANVHGANDDGLTPLHLAMERGHRPLVDALIHAGADVHARSIDGHTPIGHALLKGNLGMVAHLQRSMGWAQPFSWHDLNGNPQPLHHALRGLDERTVTFLLQNGGSPNARARDGKHTTPMGSLADAPVYSARPSTLPTADHEARTLTIVTALLNHGADPHESPEREGGTQTVLSHMLFNHRLPWSVLDHVFKAGSAPLGKTYEPDDTSFRASGVHHLAQQGHHARLAQVFTWGVDRTQMSGTTTATPCCTGR